MNKLLPLSIATLAAAGVLAVTPAATAADGDVINEGQCSAASDWKVKASEENGRIEVEGEVDSNVNGQRWTWRILDNGTLITKGTARTVAPSGSFEVRRVIADLAGPDRIVFRSTNPATGEVCVGRVTF